jgi:hypothetical protein
MRFPRTLIVLVVLPAIGALQPACATASIRPRDPDLSKPITIREGRLSHWYYQDGRVFDDVNLAQALSRHPVAAPHLTWYPVTFITGGLFGALGIAGMEIGLTSFGTRDGRRVTLAGVGAVALAVPFFFWSDHQLHSAVEAYNASLEPVRPQSILLHKGPFGGALPTGRDDGRCTVGLSLSF